MRMTWLAYAVVGLVIARGGLSAATGADVSPSRCATESWLLLATPDSALDFCVSRDFAEVKESHYWTRARPGARPLALGPDWFSLHAVSASEAFRQLGPWPPSLIGDTSVVCADCLHVENYQVHWEGVGERVIRSETGRVTGGFAGVRDKPMVLAAWLVDSTRWALFEGQASNVRGIDEMRQILRSVQVRAKSR